jgi:hypothetical protein
VRLREKTGEKILINMKPYDNKWIGRIHDPEGGSNYDSTIALKGAESAEGPGLRIRRPVLRWPDLEASELTSLIAARTGLAAACVAFRTACVHLSIIHSSRWNPDARG